MSDQPIHLFNTILFENLSAGVGINTSQAINVNEAISFCVQFVWDTGSGIIGNIYLEASNDGSNFTQIQQSILAVSGASGSHMINVEKHSYAWFRLVIDLSAGSLNANSVANGKRK